MTGAMEVLVLLDRHHQDRVTAIVDIAADGQRGIRHLDPAQPWTGPMPTASGVGWAVARPRPGDLVEHGWATTGMDDVRRQVA